MTVTPTRERLPNGTLGMAIFVGTEVMLFMGFISAFNIVKAGSLNWPPADQPRLPVEATAFSTAMLLLSGILLFISYKRHRKHQSFEGLFLASVLLGSAFIAMQGYEWSQLIYQGLTFTSSHYGSFFYLIIGCHALHAFFAILLLIKVYLDRKHEGKLYSGFLTAQVFWYFVVGMWPVLYFTVYF